MTSTDSNEPESEEWDAELADAITSNHTDETVIKNARLVATYFNTLIENDIPSEHATELTCHWVSIMHDE